MGLQNADGVNRWEAGGGFEGLLGNPVFNAGLAVAADRNQNPAGAIAQGLFSAQKNRDASDERAATKKARERQEKLYEKIADAYAQQAGVSQLPPVAPGQGQPQQSPVANPPVSAEQMLSGGLVPPTGQGVAQPPGDPYGVAGTSQYPFGSAPGPTNGGPGVNDIGALMMQFGTPQQQQAAFAQLAAGDRYRMGLAAEEARYQRKKADQGSIGNVTPSNYTPESLAIYDQTRDFGDLERYERVRTFTDADGVTHRYDSVSGQNLGSFRTTQEVADSAATIKRAEAQGGAEGREITAAQKQLGALETQEAQLVKMMGSEDFEGAVGPLDAVTGRIGEAFGSDEGVLGGQVQRQANALVTEFVRDWKGAISERELDFFLNSVPGRGSSPETWRRWFQEEYLPRKELAKRVASGDIFNDPRLEGGNSAHAKAIAEANAVNVQASGTLSNGVSWEVEQD